MPDQLRVDVVHIGPVVVVRLEGDVDLTAVDDLSHRLLRDVENEAAGLVIDLTATGYLDSAGIRLLFDLSRRLRARQQRLCLVVPDGSPLQRLLSIVEVGRVVPVWPTVDGAVDAVRAP